MERPSSTLGLLVHVARLRWQQLTARGRMLVTVAFAFVAFVALVGVRMALGGCCAGGCPIESASLEAEAVAAPVAIDETEAHEGCGASGD